MNWIEKRDICKSHQIKKITKDVAGMKAGSSMLIANTLIFDKYINNIPYGKFIPTKREYSKNHPDGIEISIFNNEI